MQFRDRVQACAARLTPTERRLATLLLEDPPAAALSSSTRIAGRAGVNASTITRLATKLGYSGYTGLRAALGAETLGSGGTTGRLATAMAGADGQGVLPYVIRQETAALSAVLHWIDDAVLGQAARALAGAQHILILAEGSAAAVGMFLDRKLRRLGLACTRPQIDPRGIAEALAPMAPGDAVIAVVLRRQPGWYEPVLRLARRDGIAAIALADHVGPLLSPAADHLLAAPRGPRGERQSVGVPIAIATALTLALAALGPERAAAAARYDGLLHDLEKGMG